MLLRKTQRRQIQCHVSKKVWTDSTQESEETAEFYLSNAWYLLGPKRLIEGCKTNFCFWVKILCNNCFQGNCVGAPDKNKLQKEKHYRGLFPHGVFFQVVVPVFSSSAPAPCIHKIPVILGSFAFCTEDYRAWEKEAADFLASIRKWRTQRRKIEDHLIQLIGIARLVRVVQDIINFPFCPVAWMYPVVKSAAEAQVPIPKAPLKLTSSNSKSKGNLVLSTRSCFKIAHIEQHVFHSYKQPSYI